MVFVLCTKLNKCIFIIKLVLCNFFCFELLHPFLGLQNMGEEVCVVCALLFSDLKKLLSMKLSDI